MLQMRILAALGVAAALLSGCTCGSSKPGLALPQDFSGVWSGDAGPDQNALKFLAKIEIEDDAGAISGEFYNEDPGQPGVYLRTGKIQGTRDGGLLLLTSGAYLETPDAGKLEPQPLVLSYDAGALVGVRVLKLQGRPPVNEYLILRRQ